MTTAAAGHRAEARRLLRTYLRDHDAGALAGSRRLASAAQAHRDPAARLELGRLHAETEEDRRSLAEVMRRLGVPGDPFKRLALSAGEQLGRLKPNGFLTQRSPLTDVVELEAMAMAVTGRLRLWETLDALGPDVTATGHDELAALQARATDQAERLQRLHTSAATSLASRDSPA
ncbi:MAG: hypothetical protein JWP82_2066 [Humibacillus sp.]|nr:hypothetical protein [Humibacillus sp.]